MIGVPSRHLLQSGHLLGIAVLLGLTTWLMAANQGPAFAQDPLGQHCYDVGPLPNPPPDWCGCTWGAVYVDRHPVAGAQVTLLFAGQTISTTSRLSAIESFPYYALSAHDLGAKYGDVVTLTVAYREQTLARTVRLLPNSASGEQQASFAFPASGHWERWADLPNVQAIATRYSDLWAGTAAGLFHWNITTGVSETLTAGLPSASIQALATGPDDSIWVGGPAGLARYHEGAWATQTTGLASSNIRGLAVAADGSVWAGASGATTGGVSRFHATTWQPQADFNGAAPNLILALAADDRGHMWVGTDDLGASRWDGAHWLTFTTADGLASNIVYDIAAEPGAVWFGTFSYFDGSGAHGGIGRWEPANGTWTHYTQEDGLAFDDVAAVAVDAAGRKWFGTWSGGISLFDEHNWWTFSEASGLSSNFVRALALGAEDSMWAGTKTGVDRFRPGAGGLPPLITAASVTPSGAALTFRAQASNPDGGTMVGYEWRSNVDGALGSEALFALPARRLTPGAHTITVRALDDEGQWSAERCVALVVGQPKNIYLPLIIR